MHPKSTAVQLAGISPAALQLERLPNGELAWLRAKPERAPRNHTYVSPRLRVFEDSVLALLVLEHKLPVSTAEELLRAPDVDARKDLAAQATQRQWTWAEARRAVSEFDAGRTKWAALARHVRLLEQDAPQVDRATLTAADRKLVRRALTALRRLA